MSNRTYHPRGKTVQGYAPQEHPLYQTWANMLSRCYNSAVPNFVNYGGRGIYVVKRWFNFATFARDMGLKPDPSLTLERINNDGPYEPANCRWDTRTAQCLNRRVFKNNTCGARGVVEVSQGRFEARFDYEGTRHRLGRFDSVVEAENVRNAFVGLFFVNKKAALAMIPDETIWCTSTTKVRGVTPHKDGGFIARRTVDGVRQYLGYFKTVEAAAAAMKADL